MKTPEQAFDAQALVNEAQRTMDAEYPAPEGLLLTMLLRTQYHRLFAVTDGFKDIAGKKVLDIACGSNKSCAVYPRNRSRMYEPWFARFAGIMGAEVMGIDRRESDPDRHYHFLQGDFVKPTTLDIFDAELFDIVNNSAFLVAPSRIDADAKSTLPTTPELLFHHSDSSLERIDDTITKQVLRILKESGYYLYNESIYQKVGGQFVRKKLQDFLANLPHPPSPKRPAK